MARVVFVNRYFFPDESATSQLLSDLAFALAEQGYSISVVTSRQRVDDPRAALQSQDIENGVRIYRVWTSRWGRSNLLGRAVDFLTFYASCFVQLLRVSESGDVIVSKTDPPLITVISMVVGRMKGAFTVNWWQDIYPEIAERIGVIGIDRISPPLRWLRDKACRSARMNVVIGRCMRDHLMSCDVPGERIEVICNWVDDRTIVPMSADENSIRRKWGFRDSFVVGYSGNIGRGHNFELLLSAAAQIASEPRMKILFIGAGAKREMLENDVHRLGLPNVVFRPFQPRGFLNESLTVPDVHVVTLQLGLAGLIVPSKFYGALAAGRPVIFIGPIESEIAQVIEEGHCGYVCDGSDIGALVKAIMEIYDNDDLRVELGENSRRVIDERFSKRMAISDWRRVLDAALESPSSTRNGQGVVSRAKAMYRSFCDCYFN